MAITCRGENLSEKKILFRCGAAVDNKFAAITIVDKKSQEKQRQHVGRLHFSFSKMTRTQENRAVLNDRCSQNVSQVMFQINSRSTVD